MFVVINIWRTSSICIRSNSNNNTRVIGRVVADSLAPIPNKFDVGVTRSFCDADELNNLTLSKRNGYFHSICSALDDSLLPELKQQTCDWHGLGR